MFLLNPIVQVGGNGDDRPALNPTKLHRFPPDTRKRIEHLIQIQKDHDQLKAQFYKDRGALEAKYEKLYQPLYDKRYNIVNGIGVTADSESPTTNQEEKGIPEFWLYALNAMYVLDKEIKDYEQGALKHLVNIKWLRTDNLKVFKLEFYFRPNPFFKNSVLTVTYHMIDEDEFIIEKIIGTEIEWTSENRLKKHRTGGSVKLVNGDENKTWCVAKPSATDSELSANIQFACNQLKDCKVIQEGGSCYNPNSLINHASVVMNLYYKAVGQNSWNCDFRGSGLITQTDPSYGSCKYA
ncbi:hypothetical protein ACLB2K_024961 [Fragaria x ananassa]